MIEVPVEQGVERYEHLLKLFDIARKMTERGMRVDIGRARWHRWEAARRANEFTDRFLGLTGLDRKALGEKGIGATKAVKEYFWQTLGAPPVIFDKKTKAPKFDVPSLIIYAQDFKEEPLRSAAAALYGIRKAQTAMRFAEAYAAVAERHNGRIHFGFNPLGTKGERWSSSASWRWRDGGQLFDYSLNAQNIPKKEPTFTFQGDTQKTKLSLSMRDCFVADPGSVFWSADYDQLELRLIAYTAAAQKIIAWIDAGLDTHVENAKLLFPEAHIQAGEGKTSAKELGRPLTDREIEVNECRDMAKPCAYALAYCMPNERGETFTAELFKQIKQVRPDTDPRYVDLIAKRYFSKEGHPEIRAWQDWTKQQIRDTGRLRLPWGSELYLPATMRGYNQAANFQMQSGGGRRINLACVAIDAQTDWTSGSVLLGQVHDELVGLADEKAVDEYCEIVETAMSRPSQTGATFAGIPAKCQIGDSWGSVKER